MFWKRVISAIILIPVIIFLVWWGGYPYAASVVLVSALMLIEFWGLSQSIRERAVEFSPSYLTQTKRLRVLNRWKPVESSPSYAAPWLVWRQLIRSLKSLSNLLSLWRSCFLSPTRFYAIGSVLPPFPLTVRYWELSISVGRLDIT